MTPLFPSPCCCNFTAMASAGMGTTMFTRPYGHLFSPPLTKPHSRLGSSANLPRGFLSTGVVVGEIAKLQRCRGEGVSKEVEGEERSESVSKLENVVDISPQQVEEGFSRLPAAVPWGAGLLTSTMIIYWAGFHVPLGLGGPAIVAKLLREQSGDPQAQAISLAFVQLLELAGTFWLIQSTLAPYGDEVPGFASFKFNIIWKDRGWLPASAVGLPLLVLAVGATASLIQDVSPSQVGNNEASGSSLANILTSTPLAQLAMYVAYCGITPCLEEYVYRGFLLSSLGKYMRWPFAVVVSALVFSGSHVSLQGFLPLFWVGCCLGMAYTWTGNLAASFVIHSLYNALVLLKAFLS